MDVWVKVNANEEFRQHDEIQNFSRRRRTGSRGYPVPYFQEARIRLSGCIHRNRGRRLHRRILPELLLCDISMPGMSGLEVVSQVTVKCPDCRVLNRTLHQPGIRPRVGALSFRTQPHHDKARTSRVTPGSRGCPASISAPVSLAANERGSGLH